MEAISLEAERIRNKEFKVLDHGFVRLVDWMGNDASIVQAARVSFGGGTKTPEEDRKLIDYLVRNRHTSPLEMVEFKFHCKMPIFVARQWIRHRTASVNEISGRYSEMKDEMFVPESRTVREQSKVNKQGRGEELDPAIVRGFVEDIETHNSASYDQYQENLGAGVSRELSRIVLPLSTYTEWYWKIDLHNLLHFLKLRMDSHAQYEIRVYADVMAKMVEAVVPNAFRSWLNHVRDAVTFSRDELLALRKELANAELKRIPLDKMVGATPTSQAAIAKLSPMSIGA